MSAPALPYRIVVDGVTKRYERRNVVDQLSFAVEPGRVTGFLGPNGSGKSTTMKVLVDLARADQGTATIGGCRYRDLPDPAGTVGVVLEPNAFHPGRSGRNHLRILASAAGLPSNRADQVLAAVGLDPDAAQRRVGTYSLGMKQRLSLAAALLADPPVLVLDEPANGLDPHGIRELRDVLRARAALGHTVLVSSHLLAEAEHLVDDVVVIHRGQLVAAGAVSDLTRASALVRTPSPQRLAEHLRAAGADVQPDGGGGLVVTGAGLDLIGDTALAAGVAVHELTGGTRTLEDVFMSLTTADPTHEEVPAR
ncbi:MAG: ATP-binding cassette domain-containing protein [Ilumatobacter sp.]|nr:ATP-binding cassette domain-containing protein [Ilumatobacter sp.]MCB0984384.1 ATP-binding cassette domain-containing protein [Ilumatobacter sp.]